jgi:ribonuclease D
MVGLANNAELDRALTAIFNQSGTVCIGFSFHSDLAVFSKCLPTMQFFKTIANFVDLQKYYQTVSEQTQQIGLAKVADQVLKKAICKGEQMSNWELRPLRNS